MSDWGSRIGRALVVLLLAATLGGLAAALTGLEAPPRDVLLRYTFAALAVLAIAPTHVLLPDPAAGWLQRLNPPPRALLRRTLGRWAGVALACVLPALGLAVVLGDAQAGLEAVLIVLGTAAYAFRDTVTLGPVSQEWQEGKRGARYRQIVALNPNVSFQIPHGMIPGTLASARVFALGSGAVLATVALAAVSGGVLGWLPGAALLAWSAGRTVRLAPAYDQAFYHTTGLYEELLRGGPALAGRADIDYDAVYWVPHRWRPHAWAGLVQLDRRLPLGRLVVLGTLGFWGLLIWGAAPAAVAGFLALGLLARNATIFLHAAPAIAPAARHLTLQSTADWAATRFWMNTRWTIATALALGIPALLSAALGWGDVLVWILIDLLFALLTALGATYAAEYRTRRRYA